MTKVATLNISFFCCNKLLSLLPYEDTWKSDVDTSYLYFFNESYCYKKKKKRKKKKRGLSYVFPTEYSLTLNK